MVAKPRVPARDAELLRRFRSGDRAAFDEIVAAHRGTVYAVARRALGSHADADEAAQLTFVKAWRALRRFRGDASIRTWLVRITLNVARTLRAGRRPTVELERIESLPDDGAGGGEETVALGQARRRLRRAVAGLPPRQREVVLLKVFSEMTYAEVARAMRLSEGAVKAHLHQAVSNLRRRLGAAEA